MATLSRAQVALVQGAAAFRAGEAQQPDGRPDHAVRLAIVPTSQTEPLHTLFSSEFAERHTADSSKSNSGMSLYIVKSRQVSQTTKDTIAQRQVHPLVKVLLDPRGTINPTPKPD